MHEDQEDQYFMKLALREAERAYKKGEVPVGAVLVMDKKVIAKKFNSRESSNDPTGHAEILALRSGARKSGKWRLTDATLYVTKEPCVMCAGAMLNARLGRLVYGCRDEKGGAVDSLYHVLTDRRLNHLVEVISGVLEYDGAEILKRFFHAKR